MGVKNIATSFLYFKDIPKIAFNQLLDINSNKIWLRCSYKHISPILRSYYQIKKPSFKRGHRISSTPEEEGL